MRERRSGPVAGLALAAAFALLATLNTGGYRYGASDQAFYVPALLLHADASLFPRDRELLAAEARFMVFDDAVGRIAAVLPVRLPILLFALHLATLVALSAAIWSFGRALSGSGWTAAALVLAMTLRHRIAKTGVNTLETNFHPRILAFALGVAALAACLRTRWGLAAVAVLAAAAVHPTTGLWFGIAVGVTMFVAEPRLRLRLGAMAAVAGIAAIWAIAAGPLAGRLVVMHPEWLAVLEGKDYLFPAEWSAETWLVNMVYPVALVALFAARKRAGAVTAAETGLFAAMAVLFAIFLAALPLTERHVALAVQLQVPRTLWLLDFVATALLVWFVVDAARRRAMDRPPEAAPGPARAIAAGPTASPRRSVVAAIAVLALARGAWVTFVERSGDPLLTIDVPQDDWGRVMRWLDTTPTDAFVLADPGHLWRYGVSVRMAARRDVYLEEVKDTALAMYSPEVAARVLARIQRLGDFSRMTAGRAAELARAEGLHYLVSESSLDLPVAFRSGRLSVYDLRKASGPDR